MKIYPLFIIVVFSFLYGCNKDQSPDYENRSTCINNLSTGYFADSSITCLTYNIQLGFKATKNPWNPDHIGAGADQVKNIANVIRKVDADIVALQEVPLNRNNAEIADFLKALAIELNMNYAFGAHGYNDPEGVEPVHGQWGNAILSKFEIESIVNQQVEYVSVWERRSMIDARLKITNSAYLRAMSLHHLPSQEGIPNTTEYLKKVSEPKIVMGDYNRGGAIAEFNAIGLVDVDATYSQHGIDRLFISEVNFEVMEIGVINDSLFTSDHWAHFTILNLK